MAASRRAYLICAGVSTLYFLPILRVLFQDVSEGSLITAAARVMEGQVPYRDFFETMGPGSFYWIAAFFTAMGTTWLAVRICLLITTVATCVLLFHLARKLGGGGEMLPVAFYAAALYIAWGATSHHTISNLFALLAFAALLWWTGARRAFPAFLAGAGAGLTTWCMLPKGALLIASFAAVLWLLCRKDKACRAAFAALAGGYAATLALGIAYFWSVGGLRALIDANLIWPLTNYGAINKVPYGYQFYSLYWKGFATSFGSVFPKPAALALTCALAVPLLAVLAIPPALPLIGLRFRRAAFRTDLLPYWICGYALFLSEIHRRELSHIAWGSPILIVLAFHLVRRHGGKWSQAAVKLVAVCAVCLALLNPAVAALARGKYVTARGVVFTGKGPDLPLDFLSAHLKAGEQLFVYPYAPQYYFLSGARNPTRYSVLMYRYNTTPEFLDAIGSLEASQVRYVVYDAAFASEILDFFPSYRMPAPSQQVMEAYLQQHYRVAADDGRRFQILERIGPTSASAR